MKAKKIIITCLVAGLLTALFIVVSAQNPGGGNTALLGTWKVRLTPGSPQAQFDELITFSPGGGMVESNNYPFFQLGMSASAGHGNWEFTGFNRYRFTFIKFLYTTGGQANGTLKVSGTINYSNLEDSWKGPATVSICDNQANNCNVIDVTNGHATRVFAGF